MRHRPPWSEARPRRGGFTLIEVLAALVIFAVAIVGIIEGVDTAISYQADLAMRQRAAMLASNVLEEIKYSNDMTEGDDSGQFEGDDAAFTWRTSIESTEITGLMKVTAAVDWGPQDNLKEYAISTLIYDQGTGTQEEGRGNTDPNNNPPQPQ